MNGPSERVESPLFTITLIRFIDSAGLPVGGPLPDWSCLRLSEFALLVIQLRPTLWDEDITGEWKEAPEFPELTTQFFLKDSVE